jgi:hypothetical protein
MKRGSSNCTRTVLTDVPLTATALPNGGDSLWGWSRTCAEDPASLVCTFTPSFTVDSVAAFFWDH